MRDDDALQNNPLVSRSALEAIHSQVFGWALSRCNYDHATAEDLVQQAYVELLTGKAVFDDKSTLQTFVFGVVQNLARSRFRRISSRLRLLQTFGSPEEPTAEVHEHDGRANNVWQAVGELPDRQRDIVELMFCRDLTIEEAASVMGVTVGTGRQHYARAKKALAARLDMEDLHD
jgi:RNA polymerase sigma-70 factor (ECF subfamily)